MPRRLIPPLAALCLMLAPGTTFALAQPEQGDRAVPLEQSGDGPPVYDWEAGNPPSNGGKEKTFRQQYNAGIDAFERGDFESARRYLKAAHQLKPGHRSAAVLAQTELLLGNYVEAAALFSYALRHLDDEVGGTRDKILHGLQRAQGEVHTLELRGDGVLTADVIVDGTNRGTSQLPHTIFLAPGPHRIELRLAGHQPEALEIDAVSGGAETRVVRLVPSAPALPPGRGFEGQPAPPNPPSTEPDGTGGWWSPVRATMTVGAGLTTIGLGLGTGLLLSAHGADDEFVASQQQLQRAGSSCAQASAACSRLVELSERRQDHYNASIVAFAAAGVAAIATAAVVLGLADASRSRSGESRSRRAFSIVVSRSALGVSGSF